MKKTIAIIVPDDCEVLVLKPGQATYARRFDQAIVVGEPIDALSFQDEADQRQIELTDRWYSESFLTRLGPEATITKLERP